MTTRYKKKDVLFKVLANVTPVSLLIMILIAAVYHPSEKAIAQTTVPYPYNAYPYPSTADVYPYSIYPYNLFLPYPSPYTSYPYPYP